MTLMIRPSTTKAALAEDLVRLRAEHDLYFFAVQDLAAGRWDAIERATVPGETPDQDEHHVIRLIRARGPMGGILIDTVTFCAGVKTMTHVTLAEPYFRGLGRTFTLPRPLDAAVRRLAQAHDLLV